MTPLHELLVRALERAQEVRPGLTLADIAREAGINPKSLPRARQACAPSTLAAVLAAIATLTGLRLDVELHEQS